MSEVTTEVKTRLRRHRINVTSLRRFIFFFPVLLWAITFAVNIFPVVTRMTVLSQEQAIDYQSGAGSFLLSIEGTKVRNCTLVPGSKSGEVKAPGRPWQEVHFDWHKDYSYDSSKPHGFYTQSFGVWGWYIDPVDARSGIRADKVTRVRLTLLHKCSGFDKITTIGPFHVNQGTPQ